MRWESNESEGPGEALMNPKKSIFEKKLEEALANTNPVEDVKKEIAKSV